MLFPTTEVDAMLPLLFCPAWLPASRCVPTTFSPCCENRVPGSCASQRPVTPPLLTIFPLSTFTVIKRKKKRSQVLETHLFLNFLLLPQPLSPGEPLACALEAHSSADLLPRPSHSHLYPHSPSRLSLSHCLTSILGCAELGNQHRNQCQSKYLDYSRLKS